MPISQFKELPASQAPPLYLTEMQTSFLGGMNLLTDETKINDNEYREAFNLSNRFDVLQPFNDHNLVSSGLAAPLQGGINSGQYIVVFSYGFAYYKNSQTDGSFVKIPNFQMNRGADRIYCCGVPASYFNLNRKLLVQVDTANNNINTTLQTQSTFTSGLNSSSPSCVVCQDGVTQPYIIFIDPSTGLPNARQIQTFQQWAVEQPETTNIREYVPIGLMMLYSGGRLYIVDPSGTLLLRSVTGRPLDFVVNVTTTGDKGGDAYTTAYSVGFSQIIALYVASGYNGIIASLQNNASIGIIPDNNIQIFGEPTFDLDPLFGTGPLNQFSTVDILGDTAFIDGDGVKSFNASRQTRIETNNSIFSLKVASLFEDQLDSTVKLLQIPQTVAAIVFNGYAIFSINTAQYGFQCLIYDTYNKCWVSLVKMGGVGIKQFISLMPNAKKLYAITTDNKILDVFASPNILDASFNTAAFSYSNCSYEQKLQLFRCVIKSVAKVIDGIVSIVTIVDRVPRGKQNKPINPNRLVNNLLFPAINAFIGWQIQYNVSWSGGGSLVNLLHKGEIQGLDQSMGQQATPNSSNANTSSG